MPRPKDEEFYDDCDRCEGEGKLYTKSHKVRRCDECDGTGRKGFPKSIPWNPHHYPREPFPPRPPYPYIPPRQVPPLIYWC